MSLSHRGIRESVQNDEAEAEQQKEDNLHIIACYNSRDGSLSMKAYTLSQLIYPCVL